MARLPGGFSLLRSSQVIIWKQNYSSSSLSPLQELFQEFEEGGNQVPEGNKKKRTELHPS